MKHLIKCKNSVTALVQNIQLCVIQYLVMVVNGNCCLSSNANFSMKHMVNNIIQTVSQHLHLPFGDRSATWVQCNSCDDWFDLECAGISNEMNIYVMYICAEC